jgi:hypothetical protein
MTTKRDTNAADIKSECGCWLAIAITLVAAALLGAACNKTRSAFEQIAERVNSVLPGLVLKISALDAVVRAGIRDPQMLLELCSSGDAEVAVLRTIESSPSSDDIHTKLSLIAGFLIDGRERGCFDRETPGRIRTTCLGWCIDAWGELAREVNYLSGHARAEGVTIFRLPHVGGAE